MSIEEKKYNLQQLRQELLKLNLDNRQNFVLNDIFINKVYGLFGDDNSFVFAMEDSRLEFNFLVSPFDLIFYLMDLIIGSTTLISKNYYLVDYFYRRAYLSEKYDERFCDNDKYKYNSFYKFRHGNYIIN